MTAPLRLDEAHRQVVAHLIARLMSFGAAATTHPTCVPAAMTHPGRLLCLRPASALRAQGGR
jgi:hypothetical protein